jgi:hypothetical protein
MPVLLSVQGKKTYLSLRAKRSNPQFSERNRLLGARGDCFPSATLGTGVAPLLAITFIKITLREHYARAGLQIRRPLLGVLLLDVGDLPPVRRLRYNRGTSHTLFNLQLDVR